MAETETLHSDWTYDTLPGQAEGQVALLSMSGYGKFADHSIDGYASNIKLQADGSGSVYNEYHFLRDSSYVQREDDSFSGHATQNIPRGYEQKAEQPDFTSTYYDTGASYDSSQFSYSESTPYTAPMITSWNPEQGSKGTPLYIYLDSDEDLGLSTSLRFSLVFAARECPVILAPLDSRSAVYKYVLTAEAPDFLSTGWQEKEVPVRLHLRTHSGTSLGSVGIGSFRYMDQGRTLMPSSQKSQAAKRAVSQQLFSRASQDYVAGAYHTGSPSHAPTPRSHLLSPSASSFSSYGEAKDGFRRRSSTYSGGSVQTYGPTATQRPGWSSNMPAVNGLGGNAALPTAASATSSPFLSTTVTVNPPLIRTTCMPGAASLSSHELDSIKVSLHINGNLESMAENWTSDERKTNRRLVQFWRTQHGRFVNAGFDRVSPDDKTPKNSCINCIYWEEKQECYITSVDAISILETLAGVRFNVEEKNRVRRNLEGMHPITMHKEQDTTNTEMTPDMVVVSREEQEAIRNFFRVIMSLQNPRPRNIEKAIKVFRWTDLERMLKKVMSKYSADYISISRRQSALSSTTTTTSQPGHLTPNLNNNSSNNNNIPETYPNSPHSTCNSTISSAYSGGSFAPSSTTSPNISHNFSTASQPDHHNTAIKQSQSPPVAALPLNPYAINYPSNMQYTSYHNTTEAMSPTTMHAPIPRSDNNTWNFGPSYTSAAAGMVKTDEQGDQKVVMRS